MKRTKNALLIAAILLSCLFQTQLFGQTDTVKRNFCFSSSEMNYWIGCSFDSETQKKVIDSLSLEIKNIERVVEMDSLIVNDALTSLDSKNKQLTAQKAVSDDYEYRYNDELNKKRVWRGATGGALLLVLVALIF